MIFYIICTYRRKKSQIERFRFKIERGRHKILTIAQSYNIIKNRVRAPTCYKERRVRRKCEIAGK